MKKDMETTINKVVKETIINLKANGILATPNEYHKEFCKVSKKFELSVEECEQFKKLVHHLDKSEQQIIKEQNITTMEDMIPILLNRVATKNLNSLASLFQRSITPSISIDLDENLAKFSIKIGNSPSLMFEEDIQKEMQDFITKRFEADTKVVKQKTEDIAKLVTLMGQYLNDAITSNGDGSKNVKSIKDSIQSIDTKNRNGYEELSKLQSKLISAAMSIENEMSEVGEKLKTGKTKVEELEEKVRTLEEELEIARKESVKDHLTGLLTRRAYEREVQRIESEFERNSTQYAVVFFDIDHFKEINDTYGHEGGDVILSTFAKVLQKETRDLDIVGRYGGEEFVAIVHFNLNRELLKYLKRIKSIIRQNKFVYKDYKIDVAFSAGVAIRNNHHSYDNTIQKADILLYEAKESGRDRIILEDGTII